MCCGKWMWLIFWFQPFSRIFTWKIDCLNDCLKCVWLSIWLFMSLIFGYANFTQAPSSKVQKVSVQAFSGILRNFGKIKKAVKKPPFLVPVTGLEPVRSISPRDFKSLVSAYSTTPAFSKTTPHFITVLS